MKTRKQKDIQYEIDFGHIPKDDKERLEYMYDLYKINPKKAQIIYDNINRKLEELIFKEIRLIIYQIPEGAMRPRARLINRVNFPNMALSNPNFIHIYSPNAKEDNKNMSRLVGNEIRELNKLITTPIIVHYKAYIKTPNAWNNETKISAEIGLDMAITKPDWDNIGKKYSDMSNANIWLDDSLVVRGIVDKYHSILPRIEIDIKYLNKVYNKYQYKYLIQRKDFIENNCELEFCE